MTAAQHFENFLQPLTTGLLTGAVYGLMCVGLSVIFGVTRVINFAQGEFTMVGMYVAWYCFGLLGIEAAFGDVAGPYVAALAAGPVVFALGAAIHEALVSQVAAIGPASPASAGHAAPLILTLGLALILSNGGLALFGSAPVSISTPLASTPWIVGPLLGDDVLIFVNQGETIAAVIALGVAVAFTALIAKTRLGRVLRAAADNPEAAVYTGINVDRACRTAFGLGVALTAIGGGLLASSHPFQPYIGIDFVIVIYAGVVLGGLGSIGGAFLGGLLIGVIRELSPLILPAQLQDTAIFVCFLLIVLLKPEGLFGRSCRRA